MSNYSIQFGTQEEPQKYSIQFETQEERERKEREQERKRRAEYKVIITNRINKWNDKINNITAIFNYFIIFATLGIAIVCRSSMYFIIGIMAVAALCNAKKTIDIDSIDFDHDTIIMPRLYATDTIIIKKTTGEIIRIN